MKYRETFKVYITAFLAGIVCVLIGGCESTGGDSSPAVEQATANLFAPSQSSPNMFRQ